MNDLTILAKTLLPGGGGRGSSYMATFELRSESTVPQHANIQYHEIPFTWYFSQYRLPKIKTSGKTPTRAVRTRLFSSSVRIQ